MPQGSHGPTRPVTSKRNGGEIQSPGIENTLQTCAAFVPEDVAEACILRG